jgi:hypothetical protein
VTFRKPAFLCQNLTRYHAARYITPGYGHRNSWANGIHNPGYRCVVETGAEEERLYPFLLSQILAYSDRLIKVHELNYYRMDYQLAGLDGSPVLRGVAVGRHHDESCFKSHSTPPAFFSLPYNSLLCGISKICEEDINDRKLYIHIIQHALVRFVNQEFFFIKGLALKGKATRMNVFKSNIIYIGTYMFF